MNKVSFSTATRYCVVELVGLPPNPDDVPTRLTIDLLQCTGVSQAGFDKLLGKWLVNMSDGFTGGIDKTKRKIKAALTKHGLEATLVETEEKWGASVYLDVPYSSSRRSYVRSSLVEITEVSGASWHPSNRDIYLTMSTPLSDQLKDRITHIITGQSPLF